MSSREKDQADFDLERFIDMFDTAMTSDDPRVVETLRKLMMIVTLTRPESGQSANEGRHSGPLRRLFDDMHNLNRSVNRINEELRNMSQMHRADREVYNWNDKYTMVAAQNMAQSIDEDFVRQLSQKTAMSFNGGKWPRGGLK